jgi:hypothetical protein
MQIPGILFWLAVFSAPADPVVGLILLTASAGIALMQKLLPRLRQQDSSMQAKKTIW